MHSVFIEQFTRVARDRPDEIVLWAPQEGGQWRPGDLLALAAEVRRRLVEVGVRGGQPILSTLGNHSTFVALALACLAEGWPLLPADRQTSVHDLQALANRWRPAALVGHDAGVLAAVSGATAPVSLIAGACAAGLRDASPPGRYGDAAVLKLTSGTSGVPKVTRTAERHLLADVTQIVAGMDIRPATRQLGVIPLSHSYGLSNLLLPLFWQGSPLLLLTGFSPAAVAEDARVFGAETWAGVPFMFDHVARHVSAPFPPSIRTVLSAGAPLSFGTVRAFHARTGRKVHSFYGSSETGGICYDDGETLDEAMPVGRPLGAVEVGLVEAPEAPAGSGRVTVRGPAVIEGYGDGIEPDAFVAGAFVTSDFARWRDDGALLLTGRATAAVNVAGRKVWPGEVEAALRALPDVREAVVLGVPDDRRGQALGACVVLERPVSTSALRTALARHLAPHKVPRIVVQLDALPLTARGKPDREAIAARLSDARRGG